MSIKRQIVIQGVISFIVAAMFYFTRTFNDAGTLLFEFLVAIMILSVPLYFLRDKVIKIWRKFSVLYIVISVGLVGYLKFIHWHSWLWNISHVILFLSILFFISSILLFIIVLLRDRNK